MKRFLLITFLLFSSFSAHARHVESALSAQKSPIGAFFENAPNLHPADQLYLIELHIAYNDFLAQDAHRPLNLWYFRARYFSDEMGRFISRDPLGYVDGFGLYGAYFAERFNMDPSGTSCNLKGFVDDLKEQLYEALKDRLLTQLGKAALKSAAKKWFLRFIPLVNIAVTAYDVGKGVVGARDAIRTAQAAAGHFYDGMADKLYNLDKVMQELLTKASGSVSDCLDKADNCCNEIKSVILALFNKVLNRKRNFKQKNDFNIDIASIIASCCAREQVPGWCAVRGKMLLHKSVPKDERRFTTVGVYSDGQQVYISVNSPTGNKTNQKWMNRVYSVKGNKLTSERWVEPMKQSEGPIHAEDNILRYLRRNNKSLDGTIGASRPVCPDCVRGWNGTGARIDNPK